MNSCPEMVFVEPGGTTLENVRSLQVVKARLDKMADYNVLTTTVIFQLKTIFVRGLE